ncbi:MAG: RHS repeat-associated core domain-containing protein, partial [Candidatus Eremiobacterota bacterium]
LYTFAYDPAGRLSTITDFDGNVTTIERDSNGNFTGVVGPYGQRLTVTTNPDGYMTSATTPGGRTTQYGYTPDGLLNSVIDPNGNPPQITEYDLDSGRVIQETDSGGGFVKMDRVELPDGWEVTFTTAMGRVSKSRLVEAGGVITATRTDTDGTVTVSETNTLTGVTTVTEPDGTVTTSTLSPDPRFGMQAPFISSGRVSTGGLTANLTGTRTVTLNDPEDPLSVTQLVETSAVNGRTTRSTWTSATRTLVERSPAGRTVTSTFDTAGRMLTSSVPGLATVSRSYDPRGRLASVTEGSGVDARVTGYAYQSDGYLQSVTDAENRTVTFSLDLDGRVMGTTLPDGRVVGARYDANGNLTSLTPPSRPAHGFDYNSRDLNTQYRPPAVNPGGPTQYDYNLDSQPTLTTRPDGDVVSTGYDLAGRLQTLTIPRGVFTYGYDSLTGKLTSVSGPGGSSRTYGYQGSLLSSLASAGPVNGSVAWTYDNNFRTTGRTVNGANAIAMGYDTDDLVTSVGPLTMVRNAQNGLLVSTTLASVTDSLSYSPFAEVSAYTASGGAGQLYSETYQRDKLGRITQRTETIEGVTTTWTYSYDTAGRLSRVDRNGTLYESYGYDSNDNRASVTRPTGTTIATFDDQDRIMTNGPASFTHDAKGDLVSKTDTSGTTLYDYDTTGQLLSVTSPNGDVVSYEPAANSRRAVKRVNGVVQRKWLYSGGLLPVVEYDANDSLTCVFTGGYILKDGSTYRLLRDHLGSVRLVVDANTGAVAQRLSYGPWGEVLEDTNPGFQPFGYAGGLYDPNTGLVRFGARDYDPAVGRWTSRDPIGLVAGTNVYAYCLNEPINCIDPMGFKLVLVGTYEANAYLYRYLYDYSGLKSMSFHFEDGNLVITVGDEEPTNELGRIIKQLANPDCPTTSLFAVSGETNAIFGSWGNNEQKIDVKDIPVIQGLNRDLVGGFLTHELVEANQIQNNGLTYEDAHRNFAIPAENRYYNDIGSDLKRIGDINNGGSFTKGGIPYDLVVTDRGARTGVIRATFGPRR